MCFGEQKLYLPEFCNSVINGAGATHLIHFFGKPVSTNGVAPLEL